MQKCLVLYELGALGLQETTFVAAFTIYLDELVIQVQKVIG